MKISSQVFLKVRCNLVFGSLQLLVLHGRTFMRKDMEKYKVFSAYQLGDVCQIPEIIICLFIKFNWLT